MSNDRRTTTEQAMDTMKVDVAVIGAGTAGLNARREVEKRGGRPVMIESGPFGTTCARVGCMPSKLLIAAAEAAHGLAHAPAFGVHPGAGVRIDGPAVMQRVQRERDRFVSFGLKDVEDLPADHVLRGRARFVAPTTLEVDDRIRVEARAVVIATGSRPFVPPPFERIRAHVLTSDDVFELQDLPRSLAVIGTGIIALELGQAMHRLGVRTAFFNPYDELGPFTDPELKRVARQDLGAELELHLGIELASADAEAGGVRLRWREPDGSTHDALFEKVLVAAGRRPNVDELGLEHAGLVLGRGGVPAVDTMTAQCGDAPIFLAGDVDGNLPLLHEAADEGRIAGANAMLWPNVERHERRTPLAVAFTDPQMAMAGLRYADLPPGGHAIGTVSYENQGRARVAGRNRGLVRLYAETTKCRLTGAEMFGPGMEHMGHLLAWAIQQGMTVQTALAMPFYHPVLEEGLRTGLRDLARQLKNMGSCRPEDAAEAPGE
jgi:dihydrolipoamide dehydrogenase